MMGIRSSERSMSATLVVRKFGAHASVVEAIARSPSSSPPPRSASHRGVGRKGVTDELLDMVRSVGPSHRRMPITCRDR